MHSVRSEFSLVTKFYYSAIALAYIFFFFLITRVYFDQIKYDFEPKITRTL